MLTGKQRAYLRSLANSLDTIFQFGKGGVGGEAINQLSNALEARELVKCRVLNNSGLTPMKPHRKWQHCSKPMWFRS